MSLNYKNKNMTVSVRIKKNTISESTQTKKMLFLNISVVPIRVSVTIPSAKKHFYPYGYCLILVVCIFDCTIWFHAFICCMYKSNTTKIWPLLAGSKLLNTTIMKNCIHISLLWLLYFSCYLCFFFSNSKLESQLLNYIQR